MLPGGGGARIGLGGLLVLMVLGAFFNRDLVTPVLESGRAPASESGAPVTQTPAEKEMVEFVSFVLDDAQATWTKLLGQANLPYRRAKLVLFREAVDSACGMAGSATGPFYCPADEKAYIDLGFFSDLRERFGAPGDFAQAYVLAHEIGHHVQNVLGIERKFRALQQRNPGAAKALSVRMELQADCFAGLWGNGTAQRGILEKGDVEEGLNAAAAIGDDRLQRNAGRRVSPESFTHGSSAQRVEWFRKGLETGSIQACDTFAGVGGDSL